MKIGKAEIKNRFCMAPMGPLYLSDSEGGFNQRSIDYYTERVHAYGSDSKEIACNNVVLSVGYQSENNLYESLSSKRRSFICWAMPKMCRISCTQSGTRSRLPIISELKTTDFLCFITVPKGRQFSPFLRCGNIFLMEATLYLFIGAAPYKESENNSDNQDEKSYR